MNFEYKELDRCHLRRIISRALAGNAQVPSSPPGAPAPSLPIDIGNSNVRRQADLQRSHSNEDAAMYRNIHTVTVRLRVSRAPIGALQGLSSP